MIRAITKKEATKMANDLERVFKSYKIENFTWAAVAEDTFITRTFISYRELKSVASCIQVLGDLANIFSEGFKNKNSLIVNQDITERQYTFLQSIGRENINNLGYRILKIFQSFGIDNFVWTAFCLEGLLNGCQIEDEDDVKSTSRIQSIYDTSNNIAKDMQKMDQEIQIRKN